MLVPQLVRAAAPGAAIGFFLHMPFPDSGIFRMLPEREAVLRGVLGADLVGFQTHADLHEFRRALLQVTGIESRMDQVEVDGRVVRLGVFPIGIVVEEWTRLLRRASVQRRVDELRQRHAGRHLVFAVDRLDYTKGIPERLRAFRRLLREAPERRGQVTLIQVAVPSRERVPRYRELRREVNELVAEVNGEFGTPEWTPVVHLLRSISRPELAALYAAADVAWVTSLRDGMNLVAKEFVACQATEPGALIVQRVRGRRPGARRGPAGQPVRRDLIGRGTRARPRHAARRAGGADGRHDDPRPDRQRLRVARSLPPGAAGGRGRA